MGGRTGRQECPPLQVPHLPGFLGMPLLLLLLFGDWTLQCSQPHGPLTCIGSVQSAWRALLLSLQLALQGEPAATVVCLRLCVCVRLLICGWSQGVLTFSTWMSVAMSRKYSPTSRKSSTTAAKLLLSRRVKATSSRFMHPTCARRGGGSGGGEGGGAAAAVCCCSWLQLYVCFTCNARSCWRRCWWCEWRWKDPNQ